jgi:CubicO group peptidase (beta-lactamase class C family)
MGVTARIEAALEGALAAGLPGVAVAARLPGGERIVAAAGVRGLDNPAPMTPDTVFWVASFTKAITTAAVLRLAEAGRVGLDDPAARWLPALAQPKQLVGFDAAGAPKLRPVGGPITVRQLLAHTSGLGYAFCNAELTRYQAAAGATPLGEAPPLLFEPGDGWTYGVGLDWAGELVAAVDGRTLDRYLADEVFAPLGMADTGFAPPADESRRASMHGRGEGGAFAAMPFQLPPAPNPMMGGGGLYSSAGDYLKFLDAILAGGAPILSPAGVTAMRAVEAEGPHVGVLPPVDRRSSVGFDPQPGAVKQWGLGFVINPEPGPNGRSAGSLAWAGLSNCYYWADPVSNVAGVFLAQFLPFGDPDALEAFGAFERAVYSA